MSNIDSVLYFFDALKLRFENIPDEIIREAEVRNAWFTSEMIKKAQEAWVNALTSESVQNWLVPYGELRSIPKTVGIICAGNIPWVGLHDILSALVAGVNIKVKLSSDDQILMGWAINQIHPLLAENLLNRQLEEVEKLKDIDALIATGSNNTAMNLDYYFRHVPRLIRGNRNSVAVIPSDISPDEMEALGMDIFLYFGMGCRNVSMVFLPEGMDIHQFYFPLEKFSYIKDHNKYANNHTYQKAVFLMNLQKIYDNDFLILRESNQIASPVSMCHYQYYQDEEDCWEFIRAHQEAIQVVAGRKVPGDLPGCQFGQTQFPKLSEYSDRKDTIQWIQSQFHSS